MPPQTAGAESEKGTTQLRTPAPSAPEDRLLYTAAVHAQKHCGKGSIIGVSRTTGKICIVPMCCNRWSCPHCAIRLRRLWAKRAADARPERLLTLTADPKYSTDPHKIRERMLEAWQKFVKYWRHGKRRADDRADLRPHTLEYMAVWELQANGRPHLHILHKGDYIPQKFLKRWMEKSSVGSITDIQRIRSPQAAPKYVTKYLAKSAHDTKAWLGTRRLIMVSAKFFANKKDPPTEESHPDYDWFYSREGAFTILQTLIRSDRYIIDRDQFPSRVELVPTRRNLLYEDLWEQWSAELAALQDEHPTDTP